MSAQQHELIPDHFLRSYDLAPTVDSTVPNRAQPGEPGSHWVARGLLVETCGQLLGRPVRLEYCQHEHLTVISVYVSLACSILTSDPLGAVISVDLLIGRSTGRWALLVQDRMLGTGPHLPSPSHLTRLVSADRRAAAKKDGKRCSGVGSGRHAARGADQRRRGPAAPRRGARHPGPGQGAARQAHPQDRGATTPVNALWNCAVCETVNDGAPAFRRRHCNRLQAGPPRQAWRRTAAESLLGGYGENRVSSLEAKMRFATWRYVRSAADSAVWRCCWCR